TVLTARNCGSLTPTLPPPVTWRSCTPAPAAAVKQPSPSETTVNGRASDLAANLSTASLVNEHCTKHARTGCPASVVCTAAMKGTLFSQPRPALPPESSPPRYASSISTRPLSWRVSSRTRMTSITLCLSSQAVLYDTPSWRPSSRADTLFFDWVSRCMARNQLVSGNLVDSKIVPLMTLHWWRPAAHCQYSRPSRRNEQLAGPPHTGQTKPCGQREAISASSQPSSVP